jgi:hypothetical protein
VNEISQVDFRNVTKSPYSRSIATDVAKWAVRHGYGDCCPSYAARSSLGVRLPGAPWQIIVNRIIKDSGSYSRSHIAARFNRPRIISVAVRPFPLKATLVAFAVTAALVAALPAARAQQAPAVSQTPASAPAPSEATTTPAASSNSSSSSADSSAANKQEPVCFKLTGHCVDASKASAKSGAAKAKTGAHGKKLNLTAPDVSTVVPEQELKEPLPNSEQVTEVQESQTVSVKTDEGVPPDVPQGLGAIWWAVVHPSQAWRIVTPY